MLMVIFGAGASYDSSPDFPPPDPSRPRLAQGTPGAYSSAGPFHIPAPADPREAWRPPLATQLFLDPKGVFGDIVANPNYRKLLPILPRLRQPLTGSVEQQLESLMAEGNAQVNGDPERKRQLFAVRYYLHDFLLKVTVEWLDQTNGVTNYVLLLDQIRRLTSADEPVFLVTFNYDLLLDRALLSFGYKQQPDPEYQLLAHPNFKLLKPHGSVNWARYVDVAPKTKLGIEQVIEQADSIKLADRYVYADATDSTQMFKFELPIVPAIAIPVQTKTEDTFEWPRSQRAALERFLPSITKILIIGWQGKEAHFLKLLRENLPQGGLTQLTHLQVVGKDSAEASNISKEFTQQIGRTVMHTYTGPVEGFSNFVRQEQVSFFFKN